MIDMNKLTIQILPESGRRTRLYILIGAAILGVLFLFFKPSPKKTGPGWQPAPPPSAVAGLEKQPVPGAKVNAYPKAQAKKKLKIPDETAPDGTEIIAAADIPPSEGGHQAIAVLDTATGESSIKIKENPRPWFALGGQTEAGAGIGIGLKGEQASIYIRQDLLRVGKVHLIVQGTATAGPARDTEASAMIFGAVRW